MILSSISNIYKNKVKGWWAELDQATKADQSEQSESFGGTFFLFQEVLIINVHNQKLMQLNL